ncbi:MAG: hypothetical protein CBC79_01295 [Gammaproteobacteria bacterium TMED119]|nr:MAG: hypothetical protein CBC79_01295 [Gammaproteobacteria bacterium TMED119]
MVRKFLQLPHQLYADDPAWIAPLVIDQLDKLSPKHPYFEHAEARFWLAFKDTQPVARISAQVDQLQARSDCDKVGCFGNFECIDDHQLAAQLFTAAENWLSDRGCQRVRGPFNLSINQECGLLLDNYAQPPTIMMGHSRPYYPALLEQQHYLKVKDLIAWWNRSDFEYTPAMQRLIDRYQARVEIRNIKPKQFSSDIESMLDIFNDAWINNWGFVPFTKNEFFHLGKELLQFFPARYFKIAEYQGQAVGMIALLPNINELISDLRGKLLPFGWLKLLWRMKFAPPKTARMALLGIKREYQNNMLGSAMVFMLMDQIRKEGLADGYYEHEMSWVLEDNERLNKMLKSIGGRPYKTYRLYEKVLA